MAAKASEITSWTSCSSVHFEILTNSLPPLLPLSPPPLLYLRPPFSLSASSLAVADNNGAGRSQIPQQPKLSAAGAHKDQRNPPRSLGHAHSNEMEAILGSRSIGDSLDYSSSTLSDTTAGSYSPVSMHPEN